MADPILLVPGTGATNLVDGNGINVWNAVRVNMGLSDEELGGRPVSEWRPLLSMQHKPGTWCPIKTSLEVDSSGVETTITPDVVVQTPYDRLFSLIKDTFPYDWRMDIRCNAQKLRDFLVNNRPAGGQRWNIVGHSQGCLLIVVASKLMATPNDFAQLVGRVVLVAPPFAGTIRAAEPLLFGGEDLGKKNQPATRAMIRTWPALYQMLPSWLAMLDGSDVPLPSSKQLTAPDGWVDTSDVDADTLSDMCSRALEAQHLFTGPFSYMGPGVAPLVILGVEQTTPITLLRGGDATNETFELGDGLVPANHTGAWGGKPFIANVLTLQGTEPHAFLCQDPEVLDAMQKWFRRPAPKPPATRVV